MIHVRKCAYCRLERRLTREHVIPSWIIREQPDSNVRFDLTQLRVSERVPTIRDVSDVDLIEMKRDSLVTFKDAYDGILAEAICQANPLRKYDAYSTRRSGIYNRNFFNVAALTQHT